MKCSKCGKTISDDVKFCPACRKKVTNPQINKLNNPKWIWGLSLILSFICMVSVSLDVYYNYLGMNPYILSFIIAGSLMIIFSVVVSILKFVKGYSFITMFPFILSLIASFFSIMNLSRGVQVIGIFMWGALFMLSLVMVIKN